jgi:protein SCO1/2
MRGNYVRRLFTLLVLGRFVFAVDAADSEALVAGVFSPPRQAPDFSLGGSNGSELKLSHYRGKVVILAFGFTSCVDVCPVTLAVLAQARKKLDVDGKDVQIVYVTVDPERDDARRMREYLTAFDPTFIGGTGTAEQLAIVYKEYGIIANKVANKQNTGASYSVSHSSYTYLIDRDGNLRALMPYGHTADDYVHDARILLKP